MLEMSNNDCTPEIRFKEFSDGWEKKILSDESFEILAGGDIDKSKVVENGKYPIYANALTNDGIVGYYDDDYRVKAPAVTVTGRGDIGHAQARMVDFTPVVRLLSITSWHNVYFLENAINNHQIVQESTGVPQLTVPKLASYKLFFPKNLEEEIKIGNFIDNIDKLINYYYLKLKKLQKVKEFFLSKLFPKEGSNVPELRFKGFNDPWKYNKLGEICQITMGQSPDGSSYSNIPSNYILVQGNADLKNGWVFPRVWTTIKTKTANAGDLIMSVRAPAGAIGKTAYDVVLGRGVAGIKGNEFIYQMLVKMDLNDYWKKLSTGSTFESLNTNIIYSAQISLPINIEEQRKIGDFFKYIDQTINLYQTKSDKLKLLKSSLLNKMFVS